MTGPGSYPRRRDVRDSRDVVDVREARVPRGGASTATATAAKPPAPRRAPESAPRRPAADEVTLIHAGDDPRGRHASSSGEGFTRLVLLTVLGALVPGAGLVAAGRRFWGWLVLLPVLAVAGAGAAVVLTGRLVPLARSIAFDPQAMLVIAAGAAVGALLWCVVIVATHASLRRSPGVGRLTRAQRLGSLLLVTALLGLVVVPSATAARYAMANHDLLEGVFGSTSRTGNAPNTAAANPWAKVPRVTVLMLGADTGADRVGTRPDTIMVASIDTKTGDTTLLNVPRQLADVPFPQSSPAASQWPTKCKQDGQNGCMLNAVYLFGTQNPGLFPGAADPGIEATRQAVSAATGLDIDYYAMVDLEGFQQLVDAMHGLTLNVPRDIPIGGGIIQGTKPERHYPITGWIKKGQAQQLDGYQALWFARSREGSDNDDRMARQQCVVSAAVKQYGPAELAAAFPSLAKAAEKNIQTDIPADELNAFVDLGQLVKGGDLRALSFTNANISTGKPDYDALRAMVKDAMYPAPAAPAASTAPSASSSAPAPAPAPTKADPHQAVDPSATC